MSDPVSRTDIEDVLSSIRRLVADEPASAARPTANGHSGAPQPGKLVLTPALRVAAADENAATETRDVDQFHDVPAPEEGTDSDSVAAGFQPDAPGPDRWEDVPLEDRIAELEAAVAGRGEEWEPDGSEIAPHPGGFGRSDPSPTRAWKAAGADEREGNEDDDSAPSGPGAEWPSPGDPDAAGDETQPESLFDAPDPDVLDEAMLRDLVSDIVREELQGALGERITRNVRKLVRREINRALACRDFD